MKKIDVFPPKLAAEQREFLTLLEQTAKVHGETLGPPRSSVRPLWDEDFFNLRGAAHWGLLDPAGKTAVLAALGEKILQEAYFIECAGMAYAGKMNRAAASREERQFFCFVGEEETRHLRMIENIGGFSTAVDAVPSFALLIGEIIAAATRPCHLLLIQILLEGWGLHYYKTLAKAATEEAVASVFKSIIKDEIRHHAAGVVLFRAEALTGADVGTLLGYLARIIELVKIGPYGVCAEVARRSPFGSRDELQRFLAEIDAVSVTAGKLELLGQLLYKNLPRSVSDELTRTGLLAPLQLAQMADNLAQAIPGIAAPA
jgi:hypothetical protein